MWFNVPVNSLICTFPFLVVNISNLHFVFFLSFRESNVCTDCFIEYDFFIVVGRVPELFPAYWIILNKLPRNICRAGCATWWKIETCLFVKFNIVKFGIANEYPWIRNTLKQCWIFARVLLLSCIHFITENIWPSL